MIKLAARMALLVALATGSAAAAQAQEMRKVRFATEGAFPPWNYTEPNGTLAGFEIDLYRDLCARAKLDCTIQAQDFDGTIPALQGGKFDAIISGMSVTPKRQEVVLFTRPYGSTGQTFATAKGGPLAGLPDDGKVFSFNSDEAGTQAEIDKLKPLLKGKVMGVQTASIASAFLDKYLKGVVDIREYKTTDQHDLDLASGRIDIEMASAAYLTTVAKKPGNEEMVLTGPRFTGGVIGIGSAIGVRKTDTELKDKLDAAIADATADGTIAKLSAKYFGYDITPR